MKTLFFCPAEMKSKILQYFFLAALAKSGSESSISEACDDSVKETSKRFEAEREDCSDKEENPTIRKDVLDVPLANMTKRGSLTSAKSLHELKREQVPESVDSGGDGSTDKNVSGSGDDIPTSTKGIRPSKSETSITDSFVVIDGEYSKRKHCQNYLREGEFIPPKITLIDNTIKINFSLKLGFKWQRQLVFRSKLTMHTAYDRKDNTEPASITALAVSKDHKTLYVGDARGRVFSWSVTEQPGRGMADHWLKDEGADQCVGCRVRYVALAFH